MYSAGVDWQYSVRIITWKLKVQCDVLPNVVAIKLDVFQNEGSGCNIKLTSLWSPLVTDFQDHEVSGEYTMPTSWMVANPTEGDKSTHLKLPWRSMGRDTFVSSDKSTITPWMFM